MFAFNNVNLCEDVHITEEYIVFFGAEIVKIISKILKLNNLIPIGI